MSRFINMSAAAMAAVAFSTVAASAAVQQTSSFDLTSALAFAASNSDLINQGSTSVLSLTAGDGVTAAPAQSPAVRDGTVGTHDDHSDASEFMSYDGSSAYSLRFNLDTVANPLGYDISSVTLISGGTLYRTNQVFGISFGLVDGSTVNLGLFSKTIVVNSTPAGDAEGQSIPGSASIRTVIDDSAAALLASGVQYIVFDIRADASSLPGTDLGTRYREIDVTGSATVPEPSALGLLGGAALVALNRRRTR